MRAQQKDNGAITLPEASHSETAAIAFSGKERTKEGLEAVSSENEQAKGNIRAEISAQTETQNAAETIGVELNKAGNAAACTSSDETQIRSVPDEGSSEREKSKDKKLSVRTVVSAAIIFLAIPFLIFCGIYFFADRQYYLIGTAIVILSFLPFLFRFEGRKPQAREIMVIAVMSAIGVVGRWAFFFVPQFKPVVAIVIITAACFGAEAGFLTGAMTGFVSNMLLGQGPWTPWQMFCFGIIGFVAGILFRKGWLKKNKAALCIFGGLATFFLYGGIINICSLFLFTPAGTPVFSWERLLATYVSAIPFDLVHAAATVIFLFILSRPLIEKLERIKIKYGIIVSS